VAATGETAAAFGGAPAGAATVATIGVAATGDAPAATAATLVTTNNCTAIVNAHNSSWVPHQSTFAVTTTLSQKYA
jgi:hypothetical protein